MPTLTPEALVVLFCLSYSSSGRTEGFPFFSEAHHVLRLAEGLWFSGAGLPFHWGDKSQAELQCCSVRAPNTTAIQLLPCAFFPSLVAAVFLLLCFVFLSSSVSCLTTTCTGPQAKAVVFPSSAWAGGSGQCHKSMLCENCSASLVLSDEQAQGIQSIHTS